MFPHATIRTRLRKTGFLFSLLLLAVGSGPRAGADFLISNLSPTQGFDSLNGFNAAGPKALFGTGYAIGVRFTVAGTSAIMFDSVQLALAYRGGTNALDLALMTDRDGIPSGSALETIRLANIAAVPGLHTATSTSRPVLTAGASYWLVATYGGLDTNVSWFFNSTTQTGMSAYRPDTLGGPGSWISSPGYSNPGYALSGSSFIKANVNGVVPAPPSVILLALGCFGLVGGRRVGRRWVNQGTNTG